MFLVQAMLMVREHIDHSALGDPPLGAGLNHVFDFGLKRLKPLYPAGDRLKVLPRQRIDFCA